MYNILNEFEFGRSLTFLRKEEFWVRDVFWTHAARYSNVFGDHLMETYLWWSNGKIKMDTKKITYKDIDLIWLIHCLILIILREGFRIWQHKRNE